jgi:hypothetical protein
MPDVLADLRAGARLLARLPGFLRHPVGLDEARRELAHRLDRRGEIFLDLVRRAIYARPDSPYARLLRHAGCEYGDLERLVRMDGVEGALQALLTGGVYLTGDELRGRHAVRRGSLVIEVDPPRLGNPLVGCDLPLRTGGSRSPGTPVGWSLAFIRDRAVNLCLAEAARGPVRRRHAVWGIPGSAAIAHLLDICARGSTPARWFSPVDVGSREQPARYRFAAGLVRGAARLGGRRLPAPEHVPVPSPGPVVDWLASVLGEGSTPYLHARPSAVLRACETASHRGVDLEGAEATVGGEPITHARAAVMRQTGLRVLPRYAAIEVGLIGDACLASRVPDEVHVLHDLVAVVQPDALDRTGTLPPGTLLVSSLRPSAPLIVLNASMGDTGALDRTPCGCPLDALGWTMHLRGIASFEKLTGEGMTFHDTDVMRVLDEALPALFGGGPGDYQLVEEEDASGRARLRLLVHPRVGPVDPRAVAEAFLGSVGRPGGTVGLMTEVWRQAALLTVEREAPQATRSGKVLHLHRRGRRGGPGDGRSP